MLFAECVDEVSAELVYKGHPPEKVVAPRVDGQSVHFDGHEHVIPSLTDVETEMAHAKEFELPRANVIEQPHWRAAARHVVSFESCPQLLEKERERKLNVLTAASSKLTSTNGAAMRFAPPLGRPLAKRFNVALLMIMVSACNYSDVQLPFDIVQGVPNLGDIPASGSHAACKKPSKLQQLDPFYARKLIGSIRKKALRADAHRAQGYIDCYAKTVA